jgi:hypothetical protein
MVCIIGHCRDHLPGSRGAGWLHYLVLTQKHKWKTYGIGEKFSGLFVSLCLFILEKFSGIVLENIDQCHPWAIFWNQLRIWHEISLPVSSLVILGQMFLSKCRFLAAHMVKCHPMSSQGILNAKCNLKIWQKFWCHSLSSPVILRQYECKMKGFSAWKMSGVIPCHPLSSHDGILWHFESKLVYFCNEISLVSSSVIPVHSWATLIENRCFFVGDMVKCYHVSSHVILEQ